MKLIYSSNLIENFLDYIEDGKVAIITYEKEPEIVNIIEDKLKSNKLIYKKCYSQNLTKFEVEGIKNIFVIGDSKLCEKVSSIILDYIYIPFEYNFNKILFNKSLINYPKAILFLNHIKENDLAIMTSYIIFYKVISFDREEISLKKENIVEDFIHILEKDLTRYDDMFNMAQAFLEYYEEDYAIFYLSIALIVIYYQYSKVKNDLFLPIDFDEKIKDLSKITNISYIDILLKLAKLKNLDESLFIFNHNKEEYLNDINYLYSNINKYINYFKNCFKNKGFSLSINYKKIIKFISSYALLLDKKELLFQISLQGLV